MFYKERELFSAFEGYDVIESYIGYDLKVVYDRFIEDNKSRDIFLDFKTDFLSFDHFYRFTLVKIFKSFIRTKRAILTIGQLVKYLKMISFDEKIVSDLEVLIESNKSPESRFSDSWNVMLSLIEKIKVKRLIIANFDLWKKSSLNRTKKCEKILYHIIKRLQENSVRTILEVKDLSLLNGIIDENKKITHLRFAEHGIVEDFYFFEYFEELFLCLNREDYEIVKDRVRLLFERYISNARGGNQILYVSYLIALAGQTGMTVSELSNVIGITAGAAGSVLKRLAVSGIMKRNGKRYLIKNNSFRKIILEIF